MRAAIVAMLLCAGATASADDAVAPSDDPDDWLVALTDRVIGELAAGKPLVVQIHAAVRQDDHPVR